MLVTTTGAILWSESVHCISFVWDTVVLTFLSSTLYNLVNSQCCDLFEHHWIVQYWKWSLHFNYFQINHPFFFFFVGFTMHFIASKDIILAQREEHTLLPIGSNFQGKHRHAVSYSINGQRHRVPLGVIVDCESCRRCTIRLLVWSAASPLM